MTQPDKLFRDKLDNYESPAPLSAWSKIEANLERPSHKGLWLKIAAGLALLAIALFAWYTTSNNNTSEPQVAEKETPAIQAIGLLCVAFKHITQHKTDEQAGT